MNLPSPTRVEEMLTIELDSLKSISLCLMEITSLEEGVSLPFVSLKIGGLETGSEQRDHTQNKS
jgi:hypothetical protein